MRSFSALTLFAAAAASLVLAAPSTHSRRDTTVVRHRRHHAKAARALESTPKVQKRARKCKAKKPKASPKASAPKVRRGVHCPAGALEINGVCLGMLPDGGTDGGPQDTMKALNALQQPTTQKAFGYYGQYSQIRDASFDGSQLKQVLDDLKESGAIFQPAVMPTNGFQIFTPEDNSGAVKVCEVMKEFTDQGIETWLRFAHECNWYTTDGTYKGTLEDCKISFQEVSKACRKIAPDVKMFWTPNMGSMDQYDAMWPGAEHVDYIGIDYYPKQGSNLDEAFVQAMKPLHDKYTTPNGPFFAIGETGLAWQGTPDEKATFFKSQIKAVEQMPQHVGTAWFNYKKYSEAGENFKILDPMDENITKAFLKACQS